jgi:hypothetical protein
MDIIAKLIILGLCLVLVYIGLAFYKERTKTDLTEAVTIILSAAGLVSSVDLGLISVFNPGSFVGELADQRIPVGIGAFAVFWVSFQTIYCIFEKHYKCDENLRVRAQE